MVSGPQFRSQMLRVKSLGYRTQSSNAADMNGPNDHYNERTGLLTGDRNAHYRQHKFLTFIDELPPWIHDTSDGIVKVLQTSIVHLLLLLLPFAMMARPQGWSAEAQFILNFLSVLPLCSLIEFVTEEMSLKLGSTVGGLFSATFGNTVEIVISVVALYHNEIQLVQASLLGDVFSHNLFSIGCCFMLGGIHHREQYFNMSVISTMSFIMAVASITMVVPTTIHFIVEHFGLSPQAPDNTSLSHGSAIVLLLIYSAYLIFQLRTHADLFDDENCQTEESQDDDDVENVLPFWAAAFILVVAIVLLVFCAQNIMLNITMIVDQTHSSRIFIGFIVIPFLSNTQTTLTAVNVALIDKMDLAISVSIGSSLQVLLFVAPVLVLVSWIMGRSLTLSFGILEAVLLLLSSFVAILILQKGRSTYLDGVLCLGQYIIVTMTMFVYASDAML